MIKFNHKGILIILLLNISIFAQDEKILSSVVAKGNTAICKSKLVANLCQKHSLYGNTTSCIYGKKQPLSVGISADIGRVLTQKFVGLNVFSPQNIRILPIGSILYQQKNATNATKWRKCDTALLKDDLAWGLARQQMSFFAQTYDREKFDIPTIAVNTAKYATESFVEDRLEQGIGSFISETPPLNRLACSLSNSLRINSVNATTNILSQAAAKGLTSILFA